MLEHRAARWLRSKAPRTQIRAECANVPSAFLAVKTGACLGPLPMLLADMDDELLCVLGPIRDLILARLKIDLSGIRTEWNDERYRKASRVRHYGRWYELSDVPAHAQRPAPGPSNQRVLRFLLEPASAGVDGSTGPVGQNRAPRASVSNLHSFSAVITGRILLDGALPWNRRGACAKTAVAA